MTGSEFAVTGSLNPKRKIKQAALNNCFITFVEEDDKCEVREKRSECSKGKRWWTKICFVLLIYWRITV